MFQSPTTSVFGGKVIKPVRHSELLGLTGNPEVIHVEQAGWKAFVMVIIFWVFDAK
jgi:hypothetical protein